MELGFGNKNSVYELSHELLSDLKLRMEIKKLQKIFKTSLTYSLLPNLPHRNENFVNARKKS